MMDEEHGSMRQSLLSSQAGYVSGQVASVNGKATFLMGASGPSALLALIEHPLYLTPVPIWKLSIPFGIVAAGFFAAAMFCSLRALRNNKLKGDDWPSMMWNGGDGDAVVTQFLRLDDNQLMQQWIRNQCLVIKMVKAKGDLTNWAAGLFSIGLLAALISVLAKHFNLGA